MDFSAAPRLRNTYGVGPGCRRVSRVGLMLRPTLRCVAQPPWGRFGRCRLSSGGGSRQWRSRSTHGTRHPNFQPYSGPTMIRVRRCDHEVPHGVTRKRAFPLSSGWWRSWGASAPSRSGRALPAIERVRRRCALRVSTGYLPLRCRAINLPDYRGCPCSESGRSQFACG